MADVINEKNEQWVRESAFGVWFLGTRIWTNHVLKLALNDLQYLLGSKETSFATILDVGFGHGDSLWMLEERFHPHKIFAVDIDPAAKSRSRKKVERCSCPVELQTASAGDMDVLDGSVDMVFCHQTFHHLVDQERAIRQFWRVLKPGGVLLFAESCRRYIHSLLVRALFRHPMNVQKSDNEYIAMIRRAGFFIDAQQISRPFPWWSREDLGAREFFGFPEGEEGREETVVNLIAVKPVQ